MGVQESAKTNGVYIRAISPIPLQSWNKIMLLILYRTVVLSVRYPVIVCRGFVGHTEPSLRLNLRRGRAGRRQGICNNSPETSFCIFRQRLEASNSQCLRNLLIPTARRWLFSEDADPFASRIVTDIGPAHGGNIDNCRTGTKLLQRSAYMYINGASTYLFSPKFSFSPKCLALFLLLRLTLGGGSFRFYRANLVLLLPLKLFDELQTWIFTHARPIEGCLSLL